MKILFVFKDNPAANPFVRTLVEELNRQGCYAVMSRDELWANMDYDIIHFQWPENVFQKSHVNNHLVNSLDERLQVLKKQGKKISITCHNLKPHTNKDEGVNALYDIIYGYCDLFIHMGEYSHSLLSEKYPQAIHVVIPHHIYDSIYEFNLDKEQCQSQLKLDKSKFNLLCFGNFRSDEERCMVLKQRKVLKQEDIVFVTPGFYRKKVLTRKISKIPERILHHMIYKCMGIPYFSHVIDDDMLEKYFTACDAVMLQRISILNSGNLPMGFYAGKVVVGPDIGNVGCILKEMGNPTFNPNDSGSVSYAIREAKRLAETRKGEANRQFAISNWNTKDIVRQLIEAYETIA